jgi:hypothetical protein
VIHYFTVGRHWTVAQTLSHTPAHLWSEIRKDRLDRGEPEEGTTASDAEIKRYVKRFKDKPHAW